MAVLPCEVTTLAFSGLTESGPANRARGHSLRGYVAEIEERLLEVIGELGIDGPVPLGVGPEQVLSIRVLQAEEELVPGGVGVLVALKLAVDQVCAHGLVFYTGTA